jgi:hypothetical protein
MTARGLLLAATLLALPCAALAGPPYVTDDPEPTETGHWENYHFLMAEGAEGQAGVDLNYGAFKDLQLTAIIPLDSKQGGRSLGIGDVELAAKYRVAHQDKDGWRPDVALYPQVTAPVGPFSTGHPTFSLPLWVQKDLGKWSVFGGGGYTVNPGAAERNYWLSGLAVTREITDGLKIGPEIYYRGADQAQASALIGLNFGLVFKLTGPWSLTAAGGPQFEGSRTRTSGYLGLKLDY